MSSTDVRNGSNDLPSPSPETADTPMATAAGCCYDASLGQLKTRIGARYAEKPSEVSRLAESRFPLDRIPQPDVRNERVYEDWCDEVRALLRVYGTNCEQSFLVDALTVSLQDAGVDIAADARDDAENIVEDFFDIVARRLFKTPNYIYHHYFTLYQYSPGDFASLGVILRQKLRRHARLCHRWSSAQPVSTAYLKAAVVEVIPSRIKTTVKAERPQLSLLDFVDECVMLGRNDLDKPVVYAAKVYTKENLEAYRRAYPSRPRDQPTPDQVCRCCGAVGEHYRRNCPHKDARCEACGTKGHLAKHCQRTVVRDPDGKQLGVMKMGQGTASFQVKQPRPGMQSLRVAKDTMVETVERKDENLRKAKAERERFHAFIREYEEGKARASLTASRESGASNDVSMEETTTTKANFALKKEDF